MGVCVRARKAGSKLSAACMLWLPCNFEGSDSLTNTLLTVIVYKQLVYSRRCGAVEGEAAMRWGSADSEWPALAHSRGEAGAAPVSRTHTHAGAVDS